MARLNELGEDALVARLIDGLPASAEVVVAAGDDCAVVRVPGARDLQLLKTDCIVEQVHFLSDTEPHRVGWKAVARTISDFAAMGGRPGHLLVTLVVPGDRELAWVEALYAGMRRCASEFGASIVGGECSGVPEGNGGVVLAISGTGSVAEGRVLLRSGGNAGDDLWVTGSLGGSLTGKHLDFRPRVDEAVWLAAQAGVHAAMDLSDGLAMDLPRLALASECGFTVDREALPCSDGATVDQALRDGEDYELLVAADPGGRDHLAASWAERFPQVPLTRVGSLCHGQAGDLEGGWDHFA